MVSSWGAGRRSQAPWSCCACASPCLLQLCSAPGADTSNLQALCPLLSAPPWPASQHPFSSAPQTLSVLGSVLGMLETQRNQTIPVSEDLTSQWVRSSCLSRLRYPLSSSAGPGCLRPCPERESWSLLGLCSQCPGSHCHVPGLTLCPGLLICSAVLSLGQVHFAGIAYTSQLHPPCRAWQGTLGMSAMLEMQRR